MKMFVSPTILYSKYPLFMGIQILWPLLSSKCTFASAGNRTRAARVAGEHSTTEPPMLMCQREREASLAKYRFIIINISKRGLGVHEKYHLTYTYIQSIITNQTFPPILGPPQPILKRVLISSFLSALLFVWCPYARTQTHVFIYQIDV